MKFKLVEDLSEDILEEKKNEIYELTYPDSNKNKHAIKILANSERDAKEKFMDALHSNISRSGKQKFDNSLIVDIKRTVKPNIRINELDVKRLDTDIYSQIDNLLSLEDRTFTKSASNKVKTLLKNNNINDYVKVHHKDFYQNHNNIDNLLAINNELNLAEPIHRIIHSLNIKDIENINEKIPMYGFDINGNVIKYECNIIISKEK